MFLLWKDVLYCIWTRICAKRVSSLPMAKHSGKDSGASKQERGEISMKVNKTFSIDLWILKEMTGFRNKSQFVCDAIKAKLSKKHDDAPVSIGDMPVRNIMAALHAHSDCDPFLRRVLLQSLSRAASKKHTVSNE